MVTFIRRSREVDRDASVASSFAPSSSPYFSSSGLFFLSHWCVNVIVPLDHMLIPISSGYNHQILSSEITLAQYVGVVLIHCAETDAGLSQVLSRRPRRLFHKQRDPNKLGPPRIVSN
jgi:hypothetical protein